MLAQPNQGIFKRCVRRREERLEAEMEEEKESDLPTAPQARAADD